MLVELTTAAELRMFRAELKLTQSQLAARLGVRQQVISLLEAADGPIVDLELPGKLAALRAKLKPAAAEPTKPSLAERRKEADLRHEIEARRAAYADRGYPSLEAYLEKRANGQPIRGHVTPSDCRYQREVLDFARANNLL